MTSLLGIHWAGIDRILYLPIPLFLMFMIVRHYLRVRRNSIGLVHPLHQARLFPYFSTKRLSLKTLFLCSSIALLFLALLQPQWGKKEQTVSQQGRDLLIVLDISRSMLAKDIKPNRLEFAKLKIRNLLSKLDVERVGLVLFSGTAILQCPLTLDHAAFLMFLDDVDVETIASGTTALDQALRKALGVFGSSYGRKNKLIVLLTDGEDFSNNLDAVKSTAAQQNVKLFALGIGSSEGAPIPKFDHAGNQIGHETDEQGKIALSKLNEKMLQDTCTTLHGTYFKATYQDTDLDQLVQRIKSFEKEKFMDRTLSLYEDQYPWLLGLGWLFLVLEWVL